MPYNDAIFVKQPGLGGSVSWHQDGLTHWDHPEWDEGIHGFNFQVQLFPTTPSNALWIVPGSHKKGRADIKGIVAANGGDDRILGGPGADRLFGGGGRDHVVGNKGRDRIYGGKGRDTCKAATRETTKSCSRV